MKKIIYFFIFCFFSNSNLLAQNSITQQAELGSAGTEWLTLPDASTAIYVTPATTGGGNNPATPNRVITYTITFPQAGTYHLFVRMRINSGGANDDSFFYGNGFGTKSPSNDNDWITSNGLYAAGYNTSTDVVGGEGQAPNGVWKWLNLSKFDGGEPPISFVVPAGSLTQTFQIGAREDGLDIDKIVFGLSHLYYTVSNLDNGQAGSTTPPPPPFVPPGPPIAQGKDKFLGCAHSNAQAVNFDKYWNQVTPENGGKWGSVEGTRDIMNWSAMDAAYQFARANGFIFKQHVMIWGAQQPAWMATLTAQEQLEEINEWYQAVASRYPDLEIVEVVNEPLHQPPSYKGALGGDGVTGWDWIIKSYELARQYFPTAKLILNDYGILGNNQSITTYLGIAKLLTDRNLLDQLGVQGHAFTVNNMSYDGVKNSLDRLATSGVPLFVTELDIDGPTDEIQLNRYKSVFPAMWEHPAVKGITLWGYRPGHWRTNEGAYIANSNGSERPALVWLREYVSGTVKQEKIRYSWVEPECGVVGSNWIVVKDTAASNNTYVTMKAGLNSTANPPSGDSNFVVIPFVVDSTTSYQVKARVNCANGDDDSYWVKLDNGAFMVANGLTTVGWEWVSLTSGRLDSGSHTLTIAYREDGAKLDKIVVTNSFGAIQGKGDAAYNCNRAPAVTPAQSFTINDRVDDNAVVGTVVATDPDENTTLQDWQITGGTGADKFAINGATGEITVSNRAAIDFDNTSSYTLQVSVSDGIARSAAEIITIQLSHVPVITPDQVFQINAQVSDNAVVGTVLATDKDENTSLQGWQIDGGTGVQIFSINSSSGEIRVANKSLINFDNPHYTLQVSVTDGTNRSNPGLIIIDIDHAPVITPSQVFEINEWVTDNYIVGTAQATDKDENTTLSGWKIVGGTGASVFVINAASGEIKSTNSSTLNFSGTPSYTLVLTVSDGSTTSTQETVTIKVSDKVYVCHDNKSKLVERSKVPDHIKHGDKTGQCNTSQARMTTASAMTALSNRIVVYPNPARGQININLGINSTKVQRIQVVDLSGRVVKQLLVSKNQSIVLPAGTLKAGVYIIRFVGDNVTTQKIVVQ